MEAGYTEMTTFPMFPQNAWVFSQRSWRKQQRGGWSGSHLDDPYLDTQMKTGANLQPELIYAELIWPLKPKTQVATSCAIF